MCVGEEAPELYFISTCDDKQEGFNTVVIFRVQMCVLVIRQKGQWFIQRLENNDPSRRQQQMFDRSTEEKKMKTYKRFNMHIDN